MRNFVWRVVFNLQEIIKNEPLKLRESLWRRKLTEAERAELQTQPDVPADLELEISLSEMLTRLPDAPVASNFTARVMQAIELEDARRSRGWSWNWRRLMPRVAIASVALVFASLALQHYEQNAHRAAIALSIASVAESQPLPSVEALKNFDAIQRINQPQHADEELLALLQ